MVSESTSRLLRIPGKMSTDRDCEDWNETTNPQVHRTCCVPEVTRSFQGALSSPSEQNRLPEASWLGTDIYKCLDEEFKIGV